jgi:hypothetical protein
VPGLFILERIEKDKLMRSSSGTQIPLRNIILLASAAGFLAACGAFTPLTEAEYVARMNADPRVWPPVVVGQAIPVQMMNDPE